MTSFLCMNQQHVKCFTIWRSINHKSICVFLCECFLCVRYRKSERMGNREVLILYIYIYIERETERQREREREHTHRERERAALLCLGRGMHSTECHHLQLNLAKTELMVFPAKQAIHHNI